MRIPNLVKLPLAKLAFVLLALVLIVAGCAGREWLVDPHQTKSEEESPVASTPVAEPTESADFETMKKTAIDGRVLSKSDVQTIPDTPWPDMLVLAIASDEFYLLLAESGVAREIVRRLEGTNFPVFSQTLFEKYVTASAMSQKNGEYLLEVPPDSYFLCLANIGRAEMLPAYIKGCIEVAVPEGKQVRQDIFWGLGGVTSQ